MRGLYLRSFIYSAGMVLISFFILGVSFVLLGRNFFITEKRVNMAATAEEITDVAAPYAFSFAGLRDMDLRVKISLCSTVSDNNIFICDAEGLILSCSDSPAICTHIGRRLDSEVMLNLEYGGNINRFSDLEGFYPTNYYVVALPISLSFIPEPIGYVFVTSESTSITATWNTFLTVFFITAMVILFVAIVMSYFTSRQLAKPINEMAAASMKFAHGDFSARVEDEKRDDEIGALTSSFNTMADTLEKSEELRREFIANISHELKTPMTTISGFADGLLDGTIPRESQEKYLRTISDETKRLSRLVRSMLDLSRVQHNDNEKPKMAEFDAAECLTRTLLNFEDKITSRGLDVDFQLPENSVLVTGEEDSITQVIYNLLDNAVKFAEQDSTIALSLWKQSGKAYISVKNRGETIPPPDLPLIFDRFHKTDRSRSRDRDGVGLGLYLVKSILNNHGEDISVTSRDNITEFVFSLALTKK